jgi:hypothetical protein
MEGDARVDSSAVDSAGLSALLDAIKHLHGLDANWIESVPVHETRRQDSLGG